ncbi:conjugal transfer protein TrbE [Sphingobium sp. TB-6]|uniref:conjugal transfer protein TrbE n=1 Tax=Sphingobium sp. TB-6 TaxID=2728850 RepID=UPI00146A02E4|nr:conjugal transfer protein TrbE [Sphingobium sp. TB-6]NML88154.1 conjugal transfer protein TrbE [Sphingobium sp. TB-6]
MLNLSEYRSRADRLADHLPWAALVAPGVVLNKDGSFQRIFRFRGPDLESATEAELVATCARANNVLKRLGSGWAIFFEAHRREAQGYPDGKFADPASWLVDQERHAQFASREQHFESQYHATLLWLPPADSSDAAGRHLVEREGKSRQRDWRQALGGFIAETGRIIDLFSTFMREIQPLDDAATLTFLHAAVSDRDHGVHVPETPFYLDGLLADTPLVGGLEPRLGGQHIRTLTLLGFPNMSRPGLLDALNHQNFGYRWVTRYIALDKSDATRALTKLRRQWFNKRKSVTALLREVMYNQPAQLLDSDADNKVIDADLALQALGGDHVAFGYLTTTITVMDRDAAAVDAKVRAVERVVNGLGFTCIRETVNAVEAWLSGLPGQVYANVRQPLVHSLNLAHLMPLSAVWAGPHGNRHLAGSPLFQAKTSGSTPFRLSTHVGDVGHMIVVGPTGAGKSVLLSFIALQFRRYAGARVIMFDMGRSARAAVLAMGGSHHALGAGDGEGDLLSFQPLRDIDRESERGWAAEWLGGIFAQERVLLTPEIKDALWSALSSLATAPVEQRTLTGLSLLLQSNALRLALAPYMLDGSHGGYLDAAEERLAQRNVQCFETEALMGRKGLAAPVLTYLFHRIEQRFDGRPTLMILDEAWSLFDDPLFAARIREWLKTLRKKNVAVLFATQSLTDISESSIAPAIIESCPQRILLPNDRAVEPQSRAVYERFGLNTRQIELISRATPKRHYYLQSQRGNRLFELDLGPVALALCGASDPDSQRRIDAIITEHGLDGFAGHFLSGCGLPAAADDLELFPSPASLQSKEK